ncbi:MAG: hypothetical protein ACK5Q5_24470 [Planctomycetaceae bacterium]
MKRLAQLAACGLMLAASTGCCWHNWGGGGCGGGCGGCGGGYGAGYSPYQGAYAPMGATAMNPGMQTYANAPMIAPTTAYAPLNPIPTY